MESWIVEETHAGERLDRYVAARLPELSRSLIQKRIKEGGFIVNGKVSTAHKFLKAGDVIEMFEGRRSNIEDRIGRPDRRLSKSEIRVPRVIAETDDWIVLDKPAGLVVHPDAAHKEGTLVDWLLERDPRIAKVGEHPDRPGIVHRLDREVSGLLVAAKTQRVFEDLQKQFRERLIEKRYLALVHGEITKDEGDIKFKIARSATKARMAARPAHEEKGRAAWTHYRVLKRYRGATLVELQILSGRTHQIRAHLLAFGHPVIGDALYAHRQTTRNVAAPRLLLQSVGLAFNDPATGERKSFELPADRSFDEMIKQLKP